MPADIHNKFNACYGVQQYSIDKIDNHHPHTNTINSNHTYMKVVRIFLYNSYNIVIGP